MRSGRMFQEVGVSDNNSQARPLIPVEPQYAESDTIALSTAGKMTFLSMKDPSAAVNLSLVTESLYVMKIASSPFALQISNK